MGTETPESLRNMATYFMTIKVSDFKCESHQCVSQTYGHICKEIVSNAVEYRMPADNKQP